MYFVPAPAAACDDFPGTSPDNAPKPKQTQKTELKLVPNASPGSTGSAPIGPTPEPDTDQSSLAARILQMHASADTAGQTGCRPPKLVGAPEDQSLDLPGILKRQASHSAPAGLTPQSVPHPSKGSGASARTGPGFPALLASTVVIAALAAGGLYAASGHLFNGQQSRTVASQSIVAEPTIESLIAKDAAAQAPSANTENLNPSPQQIAQAKDRIRRAFHASGALAHTSEDYSRPLSNRLGPEARDGDKNQARLVRPPSSTDLTPSPHASEPVSPIAVTAAGTTIAATRAVSPAQNGSVSVTPGPTSPIGPAETAAPVAAANEASDTSARAVLPDDGDYPNTGTVTASVNFRQSEDNDATVLGVIPAGTDVRYDTCGPWWCGIVHQGQTGFVGQKFLERTQ